MVITSMPKRGATLILAIIVITSLALFGLSLVSLIFSRISSVDLEVDKIKALYLAEAGIAKSLHELKRGTDIDRDGLGIIPLTKFAGGDFTVKYNSALFTFTAIGIMNSTKRSIQLKCIGG